MLLWVALKENYTIFPVLVRGTVVAEFDYKYILAHYKENAEPD